jgi:hypothetical protein
METTCMGFPILSQLRPKVTSPHRQLCPLALCPGSDLGWRLFRHFLLSHPKVKFGNAGPRSGRGGRGISGVSHEIRSVIGTATQGKARAQLSIALFCYRLPQALPGLTAVLPSIDALIFTGGIGEDNTSTRHRCSCMSRS